MRDHGLDMVEVVEICQRIAIEQNELSSLACLHTPKALLQSKELDRMNCGSL